MKAYFPISQPMIGSMIPGPLVRIGQTKLVNYPDFSVEKLITRRKEIEAVTKFPDMNQQHGAGHPILEKLKQMMSGGNQHHPQGSGQMSHLPSTREGYQPIRENLDWRRN